MTRWHPAAAELYQAWRTATPIVQFSERDPFDLTVAYQIQAETTSARIESGERACGVKLGFTSRAKMEQMGVSEVICGRLTSGMSVADGGVFDSTLAIKPRIEPEIVFLLGRDIEPQEPVESAVNAVDAVAAGLEIIDSRYSDFRFSLEDVVADNASSCGFIVGSWRSPRLDLGNLGVLLECDGAVVDIGSTASILGDPWRAVRSGIALSRRSGSPLRAGDIVLAGAATAAAPFVPGTAVRATIAGLGSASVTQTSV